MRTGRFANMLLHIVLQQLVAWSVERDNRSQTSTNKTDTHTFRCVSVQAGVQPQRAAQQNRSTSVTGSAVRSDQAQPALSGADRLVPVSLDVRRTDTDRQTASDVHEAYDLETFLKERDACGVRYRLALTTKCPG